MITDSFCQLVCLLLIGLWQRSITRSDLESVSHAVGDVDNILRFQINKERKKALSVPVCVIKNVRALELTIRSV